MNLQIRDRSDDNSSEDGKPVVLKVLQEEHATVKGIAHFKFKKGIHMGAQSGKEVL